MWAEERYLAMVVSVQGTGVDNLHEWVSLEYNDTTWLFDVTFLTSNWTCIWDQGCLGVREDPTPEAGEGCCSFGAHAADAEDFSRVRAAAERLTPEVWQHHTTPEPFVKDDEGVWTTALVDNACVFLNRPGFANGHGCALHAGATAAGEPITEWKPEVCWQLPLRLEHHHDDNGHQVATLREWTRNDWGDGGQEFHWWCTEDALAFVEHTPVYARLTDELGAILGQELLDILRTYLDKRSTETLLPHPASRRTPTSGELL
jgi:hypothetical protein